MVIASKRTFNGVEYDVDFSDDEVEHRWKEIIRRACRQKPTFSLETGQPFEGPRLSLAELHRRGYDVPEEKG